MSAKKGFNFRQGERLAKAFNKHKVDYLLIGKSGAIVLGFPGTTQDVDVYPKKDAENGKKIIAALTELKFKLDKKTKEAIIGGKDFVQIKTGPFDIDLVFAPDGFENYDEIKQRAVRVRKLFPVANIHDIIKSKEAAKRPRDLMDLPLLKEFAKTVKSE